MLVRVIAPLLSAEALFLWVVANWLRHPETQRQPRRPVSGSGVIRHVMTTVIGGYISFLAIVLVFHVWIAGQREALESAVAGGAFLAFGVAAPVFLLLAWLDAR